MANEKRLIELDALIDNIDWDNDLQKWTLRGEPEDIPTVDAVEVVHGRWIKRVAVSGEVYCSECGTIEKVTDSNFKTPHCPWCGAKMDGDGNGTA